MGRQVYFLDLSFWLHLWNLDCESTFQWTGVHSYGVKYTEPPKKVFDFNGQIKPHIKGKHLTIMTKHGTELLPRYLYFFTCTLSLNFPLMYIFPKKAQDKKFVALLIYPHLFGFVFIFRPSKL